MILGQIYDSVVAHTFCLLMRAATVVNSVEKQLLGSKSCFSTKKLNPLFFKAYYLDKISSAVSQVRDVLVYFALIV